MKSKSSTTYGIRNWSEYDTALKQRGRITFWINEDTIEQWRNEEKTGRRGASNRYSDLAIMTMGTVQAVFGIAGRQTEGFLASVFTLMGIDLAVPDHSTLSRRLGKLSVALAVMPKEKGVHVVVDSTGVKVYGEGEWKTRQHGIGKRRTWRKLHLGVDEATGEILAAVVTTNNVTDGSVLSDVLNAIDSDIEVKQVSGDGAYDQEQCYDEITAHGAEAVIPPRKNAKIRRHGNRKGEPHPRDRNLRRIRKVGRERWKEESGYHRRSISENANFRLKTIFGSKLRRRKFDNQAVELFLQCAALNRMTHLGMPESFMVER
jgi:hypothetical protein